MMMSNNSRFWNVLRIAFSASFGGFVYGYYLGLINNFPPNAIWIWIWVESNNISLARQRVPFESTFSWIAYHGMGSLVANYVGMTMLSSILQPDGKKLKLQSLATWPYLIFIILGAFLLITSPNDIGCVVGMLLIGNATIIFVGSTIYLAEISPTRIRGAMVATFFLQIAAGQIVFYLISLVSILHLNDDYDEKYLEKRHWMLGLISGLFMLILRIWVPESPMRLYAMGKKEEAIEILRKTRPSIEDVARGVEDFKIAEKNITYPSNFPKAISTCLFAGHFVGMDMVMYYTPRILAHVLQLDQYPSSSKYLMLATLLAKSVLSAIGTLLCIAFVDRYGRRRLLLLTTFGIITCLGFLSFVLYGRSSDIAASCTITGNGGMGNLGFVALGALGMYFIFHSMGIGTIPWIISTELHSLEYRIAFGFLASLTYWFNKIWIGSFYIYLDKVIGQYNIGNLFVILCLSSVMALYIIYVFALDTTIEEVEKLVLMENISSSSDVEMVTNGEEMPYMFSSSDVEMVTNGEEMPYMFSSSSSDDE